MKIKNNADCGVIIKSRVWLWNGSGKMEVKRRGAQEIEGGKMLEGSSMSILTLSQIKMGELLKTMTNS